MRQRFMKPIDVSKEINLSYQKTIELIRIGKIPSHKFGGSYRVERGEFEKYLQETKVKTPAL